MDSTRRFYSFLTGSAVIVALLCEAVSLPLPTELSFSWIDQFTVNVSWKKPIGLPEGTEVQYMYSLSKHGSDNVGDGMKQYRTCTPWRNFTEHCLTEEMNSDRWTYNIWTVDSNCNPSNQSRYESITIYTPKPRAEVVKDFKCLIYSSERNCSWIPVNRSLKLTLSYRTCGKSEEHIRSLKKCEPYSSGVRDGCNLQVNASMDVCMVVETKYGMSTFKPVAVVPSPKMSIREEGDKLKLSWTPQVFNTMCWIYEVCYHKCSQRICQNYTSSTAEIPYDKRCRYEFQSRVMTTVYCLEVSSDYSPVQTYGTDEPQIRTVVAIVIPIFLSVCVILSCFCFRRHSAIICPIIPDPSSIFKEMMMNGNKELKTTTGSLYTPVPEPIEPCKITLITDINSILQQNSD